MRVAVTYEAGRVFEHFGHTPAFKLYDVNNGQIDATEIVRAQGDGHAAHVELLTRREVEVLLCSGLGASAQKALEQSGIIIYSGLSGEADECVAQLIGGALISWDAKTDTHAQADGSIRSAAAATSAWSTASDS